MAFGRSRDLPTPTAFSGKAYGPGSGIQHQQQQQQQQPLRKSDIDVHEKNQEN